MSKLAVELAVEMDDGQTHVVVADQRDYARLETQPEAGMHTRVRFLAWSALTRQQRITSTFERFNTVDCVEVTVTDDPDQGDEQGLDPGRPDTSGGNSSTSPSGPGSRSRAKAASKRGTPVTSTP